MVLLYIYLAISILTFVLFEVSAVDMAHKFKLKYPNLQVPRYSWANKVGIFLRTLIGSFIPLVNIVLLWVIIFNYDELERRSIEKIREKCTPKEETV